MRATSRLQELPRAGPAREALREKGQFWTPPWVAEAMVAYVLGGGSDSVFDPAVGEGAFFRAANAVASETGRGLTLLGTEVDPATLGQARQNGLSERDLAHVRITDFVLEPPEGRFSAIVANPPYVRHHRLANAVKERLKSFGASLVGEPLDGRAGLHVYFLLRSLQLLADEGRLAFIVPADTFEGVFAPTLWRWIARRYCLEAVITFEPDASPFPDVDTNPIILFVRNAVPRPDFTWVRCRQPGTPELKAWVLAGWPGQWGRDLAVYTRPLSEGLATGLSRTPAAGHEAGPTLGDFASVMRGIATGANDFFFLTARQARHLSISDEYLVPTIGRTRDVRSDEITLETVHDLETRGRPTLLFSPGGESLESFPPAVRLYLKQGEALGLPLRPLIATRRPWYKMERREPPPILFAYLGRRNTRFIRNYAGVLPLTGFLCVYPRRNDLVFVERMWRVLRHPDTISSLRLVGKSYGGGAIKVEPRALEALPLPGHLVAQEGLELPGSGRQLKLLDGHHEPQCDVRAGTPRF
ncbi:MAG: N-6 DNA methylase [Chloroflexi bacterium]|nr:N-6 DNA methylase [Chloroflexota bacterium]